MGEVKKFPKLKKEGGRMARAPELRLWNDDDMIVDLFAGGGGASVGIERALGRSPDVAINHDKEAISIHRANHPDTEHYIENVWRADPRKVAKSRRVGLMWLSPDCKHFSKAKGGKPKSKKIRSLAWVAVYWVKRLGPAKCPRVIVLENVEEFQKWGPLLPDGTPCPARMGTTFRRFVRQLENLGYAVEWRELVAADYGAPTSRKRLFLIARCDGNPIVWPEPTHGPGRASPWRSAAECLDFGIPCPSIFERKRPLAENTQKRIARGIERYVKVDPYIVPAPRSEPGFVDEKPGRNLGERAAFLTAIDNGSNGAGSVWDPKAPLKTITLENRFAVAVPFLKPRYGEREGQEPRVRDVKRPMPTVVPTGNGGDLVVSFLAKHNAGHEATGQRLTEPVAAVTGRDSKALVTSNLVKLYGSCNDGSSVKKPMPTVTSSGNHLFEVRAFLMKYHRDGGQLASCKNPMPTVVCNDSLALVEVKGEPHVIVDIGMRMLKPRELFRSHDFPDSYQIERGAEDEAMTQEAQVRMVGNSVPPPMAEAIVRANLLGVAEEAEAA